MRTIVTVIGVLTLAQWVFVGLLHLFLTVQDKRSPQTLSKLHDTPVIGGYFPAVEVPDERDEDEEHAAEMRVRLIEARRYYDLPKAFDEKEFLALINDIKSKKSDLERERRELESRWAQVRDMTEEIARRETTVNVNQTKLDELARRLRLERDEMKIAVQGFEVERDMIEEANLKKMARWLNNVAPEKVAKILLTPSSPNETDEAKTERYRDAAKILSLMEDEAVAKVIEAIEPVDWVRIEEQKRALPVKKKKK